MLRLARLWLVAGDRQRRVLEAKAQQRGISYAEMERTAFSYTSIKDYVTPEQIADRILFMCSPRGRTISGQAISICGDTRMPGWPTRKQRRSVA